MESNGADKGPRALTKELADRGWSQRELARRLGVSPSTVTRWLNGERAPDRAHMGALRKLLDLSSEVWLA